MTTILDCETELGKCEGVHLETSNGRYAGPEDCTIYVQTIASLNGSRRLLKIEQRCYVRSGEDVPDQPWVKPEMILEPAVASEREMIEFARQVHERFVQKARTQLPAGCWVDIPPLSPY